MKIKMMISAVLLLFAAGCGGGGGGGTTPAPPASKTTVSGDVVFPAVSAVGKQVLADIPAPSMTVFDLKGNLISTIPITLQNGNTYIFSGLQLDSNIDYVLVATRGSQKLRKVLSKNLMDGSSITSALNLVTTTAVIFIEQQLNLAPNLLGSLTSVSNILAVSSAIAGNNENQIQVAVNSPAEGNLHLVNLYNRVMAAVKYEKDPAFFVAGTLTSMTPIIVTIYTTPSTTIPVSMINGQYVISSSVPAGQGTVVCDPQLVDLVGTSACTITPAPGYKLSALTDNNLNVLSSVSGNSYTLQGVTTDHNIVATFTPYTSALLKINIQNLPADILIGGLQLFLPLPTGVSPIDHVDSDASASIVPTGSLAAAVLGKGFTFTVTNFSNSSLRIGIASSLGFSGGDIMNIKTTITPGSEITNASFPTEAIIESAVQFSGPLISGLKAPMTVTLQ